MFVTDNVQAFGFMWVRDADGLTKYVEAINITNIKATGMACDAETCYKHGHNG